MTAIVGVLNKHAIAVAADSAVTVGSGVKVYDKANKIFTLSKHHPVGVAIYSNAAFNSCVPWEIIIKMFRKHIGDQPHNTVQDYAREFLSYLDDFRKKYITEDELRLYANGEMLKFWSLGVLKQLHSNSKIGLRKDDLKALKDLLMKIEKKFSSDPVMPEFSSMDRAEFVRGYESSLAQIQKDISDAGGDSSLCDLAVDALFHLFTKYPQRGDFSGISFFGYGEEEIYPSLYRIHVFNCLNGKLYWTEIGNDKIDKSLESFICPMAQKDEMQAYITGINPNIEDTLISGNESILRQFLKQLADSVCSLDPIIADRIATFEIGPLMAQYAKKIEGFKQEKSINPLIRTVSSMTKEDLAELAENLIYMTSLKRHITPNLETVGGPVDVALVSKGDGFIWIKRKHYFDPNLNKSFFDNYLEK